MILYVWLIEKQCYHPILMMLFFLKYKLQSPNIVRLGLYLLILKHCLEIFELMLLFLRIDLFL